MKVILSFALFFVLLQTRAQNEQAELESRLFNLPDVEFKIYSKPRDKYLKYLLKIKQPLDHQHV